MREVVEKSPRLKLVYLPVYSPELNLIERVWHFFKKKILNNRYYKNLADFRKTKIKFSQRLDGYADEVKPLLGGDFEGHN